MRSTNLYIGSLQICMLAAVLSDVAKNANCKSLPAHMRGVLFNGSNPKRQIVNGACLLACVPHSGPLHQNPKHQKAREGACLLAFAPRSGLA